MSRPSAELIELAAGRSFGDDLCVDEALVASAGQHGMQGLLYSALLDGEGTVRDGLEVSLAEESLRIREHTARLWRAWSEMSAASAGVGLDLALVKGPGAELRWYDRVGERPCVDLDVWLRPGDRLGLEDLVAGLEPDHDLLRSDLRSLVEQGELQSIQLTVAAVSVDLHLDVLKLGVPSMLDSVLWDRAVRIEAPDGQAVTVLDPIGALLHHLVHLNKDRFRRLLGLADVARILDREQPDLKDLDDLARQAGLEVPVLESLRAVVDELRLDVGPVPDIGGPRSKVWAVVWPERVRLAGDLGLASYRYRQKLLPFLLRGRGRMRMACGSLARDVLPSKALVAYRNPDISGGYLRRLTLGRLRRWRVRRRSIRQAKGGGER